MKSELPSLVTPDAQSGLALADQLAGKLLDQMERAKARADGPGGMYYGQPAPVPREITASILFYAIAAANDGWSGKS